MGGWPEQVELGGFGESLGHGSSGFKVLPVKMMRTDRHVRRG